jgi:hypothetical protein
MVGDLDIKVQRYWRLIQQSIFPDHVEEFEPQTPQHGRIMVVLDFLNLERFIYRYHRHGRPPRERHALAASFVAKAVLNLPSTKALIDRLHVDKVLRRLCGFEMERKLPCEATFSNAFAEFAEDELPSKIHEAIVKCAYSEQHDDKIVGHVSRDSTDILARGKVSKRPKSEKGKRRKKIKGKNRRVVKQLGMCLEEMLDDLPRQFDCGTKHHYTWKGFKLHLDVGDGGIPLSAILTSASVHDSQVAIPLEEMTSKRVKSLYSLMDSAYDCREIRDFIASKGKVGIIEPHRRPNQTIVLDPAERRRFRERTTVERTYSQLKDNYGGRHVRTRGHLKVTAHLLFGIIALTAEQLVRVFT